MSKDKKTDNYKRIAENRKARFDYFITDTLEAGIALTGTEVKALRLGRASIKESYVGNKDDAPYLFGATIEEYPQAGKHLQHSPRRPRALLIKKHEWNKLVGQLKEKSITIVPLDLYFNDKGLVKVTIGLAKGKKQHDKRETIKQRDWSRQKARILKENG